MPLCEGAEAAYFASHIHKRPQQGALRRKKNRREAS